MTAFVSRRALLLAIAFGGLIAGRAAAGDADGNAQAAAYRRAAEPLVADLSKHSPEAFARALDKDVIVDKALASLQSDSKEIAQFRTGLGRGIERVGEQLVAAMPKDGYAKLLRVEARAGEGHCLVRIGYGDNGYGYMDWVLRADKEGRLRVVDWFDFSTGQYYTDSLRQLSVMLAPNPTVLGKIFDIASGKTDHTKQIVPMLQALGKRDYGKSYELFGALDEDLRRNRILSVIAVNAASRSQNDGYYRAALAHLDKYHGGEPTLVFLLIDHYFYTNQYGKLLRAIDSFEKYVGVEDAAMLGIKANSYLVSGKSDDAIAAASRGTRLEPELASNYWTLVTAYNKTKRYDKLIDTAGRLRRQFGFELKPAAFEKDPEYKEFVRSAEFRRWKSKS